MDIEEFKKRLGKEEPLNEELRPYLVKTEMGIPMLKHPLIFVLFYTEMENARINMYYEQKVESIKNAIKTKDWSSYIWSHERPYRLNAFLEVMDNMKDKEYWQNLGEIWIDSENIWQNKREWKMLLNSKRPYKEYFMEKKDRIAFSKLPDTLTIYRGFVKSKNSAGFSYTLDKAKAEWFSKRFGNQNAAVRKITIHKQDAFAYLTGRNENEIIYLK